MPVTNDLIKTRDTELATMVNKAKTLYAAIEAKGDAATAEDRTEWSNLMEEGKKKKKDLDDLKAMLMLDEYVAAPEGNAQKAIEIALAGGSARRSWGRTVLESDEFKTIKGTNARELPHVEVGGFLKALYGTTDTAGGYAVNPDRRPEILDIARQVPQSILDLVNRSTTNSDAVEYILMDTRDDQSGIVTEFTGGNTGLKPESNLTLDDKVATVKTIATWIAATRQILADAPRLRQLIDNELMYMVERRLERLLLADILAWPNIQTRVHAVSGRAFSATDNIADTLKRAITDIMLEFYDPDGIVLHPTQAENLELLKDDNKQYLRIYDSVAMRLWRVPVSVTASETSGTALVSAFKMGVTLWDREQTQIFTGQPNDYMLRNVWAILAELRAAWAVVRPKAVEKVTGLPS